MQKEEDEVLRWIDGIESDREILRVNDWLYGDIEFYDNEGLGWSTPYVVGIIR